MSDDQNTSGSCDDPLNPRSPDGRLLLDCTLLELMTMDESARLQAARALRMRTAKSPDVELSPPGNRAARAQPAHFDKLAASAPFACVVSLAVIIVGLLVLGTLMP